MVAGVHQDIPDTPPVNQPVYIRAGAARNARFRGERFRGGTQPTPRAFPLAPVEGPRPTNCDSSTRPSATRKTIDSEMGHLALCLRILRSWANPCRLLPPLFPPIGTPAASTRRASSERHPEEDSRRSGRQSRRDWRPSARHYGPCPTAPRYDQETSAQPVRRSVGTLAPFRAMGRPWRERSSNSRLGPDTSS